MRTTTQRSIGKTLDGVKHQCTCTKLMEGKSMQRRQRLRKSMNWDKKPMRWEIMGEVENYDRHSYWYDVLRIQSFRR